MNIDEVNDTDKYDKCLKCVECGIWSYPDTFQELNPNKCEGCCIELYDPIQEVSA